MALGMSTVTTHCTALFIQTLILIASLPKQKCLVLIFIYVSYSTDTWLRIRRPPADSSTPRKTLLSDLWRWARILEISFGEMGKNINKRAMTLYQGI